MRRYRLAIIASHVIQYQDPFFRRLAADPAVDLTVLYCSRAGIDVYRDPDMQTSLRWDLELLSGYDHQFLRNFGRGDGYVRLVNPGVIPAVLRGEFDAVLLFIGWGTVTSLLAIAASRAADVPLLMHGDSSYPPPETSVAARLRAGLLRGIIGLCDAFLSVGQLNESYYRHYGAPPERLFSLPWSIDNERFSEAAAFAPGERDAMRERFGIRPDQVAFVFSAKLVEWKDPMTLLRALARLPDRDRAVVVFLGHGKLREMLETFARDQTLNVRFAGFVNQTEIPKHYAMCDVFVLPSTYEPRGTVINEAMACGLPVIVTDACGAIGDIVQEGENAFVYPAGDDAALAARMQQLMEDGAMRERMARRSREIIATWDYTRGVEGVKDALEFVTRHR